MGFWSAKTLLSAVELKVFTELAHQGPLTAPTLAKRIGIHPRGAQDFFDALVALGMLTRSDGVYQNTSETDYFLDATKPSYMGGWLELANHRLYSLWGSLTEGLRTGHPQNEIKSGGDMFNTLYSDPERLESFLSSMTGLSMGAAKAIASEFPWEQYQTFVDIGTAQGAVPAELELNHSHLSGWGFDLEEVRPAFEKYLQSRHAGHRVGFKAGNFFKDPLPQADVLIMGHILHDWNLEEKKQLLSKGYQALPEGGALIVYETLIDDERRHNALGLLMSLNMVLEHHGGFDYTGEECRAWMRECGFRETKVQGLTGYQSMVVGTK